MNGEILYLIQRGQIVTHVVPVDKDYLSLTVVDTQRGAAVTVQLHVNDAIALRDTLQKFINESPRGKSLELVQE